MSRNPGVATCDGGDGMKRRACGDERKNRLTSSCLSFGVKSRGFERTFYYYHQ